MLNHVVDGAHHAVDVGTAPVAKAQRCAALLPLVVVVGGVVGGNATGIEIVVVEDAVHVIVGDNLLAHVHNAVDGALLRGVKDDVGAVGDEPSVVLQFLVFGGVPVGAGAEAVGVHPRVALHAALVAAFHHILQRVVAGVLAAGACQVARPRLITGAVHGIAHGTYLEVHSVEVGQLQRIEHAVDFGLLYAGCRTDAGPVERPHRCHPCRAEFLLRHAIGKSLHPQRCHCGNNHHGTATK